MLKPNQTKHQNPGRRSMMEPESNDSDSSPNFLYAYASEIQEIGGSVIRTLETEEGGLLYGFTTLSGRRLLALASSSGHDSRKDRYSFTPSPEFYYSASLFASRRFMCQPIGKYHSHTSPVYDSLSRVDLLGVYSTQGKTGIDPYLSILFLPLEQNSYSRSNLQDHARIKMKVFATWKDNHRTVEIPVKILPGISPHRLSLAALEDPEASGFRFESQPLGIHQIEIKHLSPLDDPLSENLQGVPPTFAEKLVGLTPEHIHSLQICVDKQAVVMKSLLESDFTLYACFSLDPPHQLLTSAIRTIHGEYAWLNESNRRLHAGDSVDDLLRWVEKVFIECSQSDSFKGPESVIDL